MEYKIQNIVRTCDCGFPIRIKDLVSANLAFVSYKPKLFLGSGCVLEFCVRQSCNNQGQRKIKLGMINGRQFMIAFHIDYCK